MKDLEEKLVKILEPHYWDKGRKHGKYRAENSQTYKEIKALLEAHTQTILDKLEEELVTQPNEFERVWNAGIYKAIELIRGEL